MRRKGIGIATSQPATSTCFFQFSVTSDTAGTYTNTLTVMDYADQSASASLVVTITGSSALVHVPWLIINGIEQSHEVYSGKTNTLKAVARG